MTRTTRRPVSLASILPTTAVRYATLTVIPATHCGCGVRLTHHVDGWDGNRLDCAEAKRRNPERIAFRAFLTAPTTGPLLDALIADNTATDAAIEAERLERDDDDDQGGRCSGACGFCGRCS